MSTAKENSSSGSNSAADVSVKLLEADLQSLTFLTAETFSSELKPCDFIAQKTRVFKGFSFCYLSLFRLWLLSAKFFWTLA